MTQPLAIELRSLSKSFGACQANKDVSVRVRAGSIHALIGENGAGKSTAMKMLYGVYPPDSGEILIHGEPRRWGGPADAIDAGIGMVHQHFMLADPYSALENVLLGIENKKSFFSPFIPPKKDVARQKLDALSKQYGFGQINWQSPIEDIPVGIQQRIEILKLLYQNASILILDEPTAVLTPQETSELFINLKKLAHEGKTVLIITHKLKEVMALADDVTVLRGGRTIETRKVSNTNPEELASFMVGRKISLQIAAPPPPQPKGLALEVSGLSFRDTRSLHDVSLKVHGGEIVGIAGVEGNGQSELIRAILRPRDFECSGSIKVMGEPVLTTSAHANGKQARSTQFIRKLAVGVIPEDRHQEGLLLEKDLEENFLLGLEGRKTFSKHGWLLSHELKKRVNDALEKYDVRPRDPHAIAGGLSGGNQQKLIVAREFELEPKFLIAGQPTRGVDVGAIEYIHSQILRARKEGAGVLLISSELDEIFALSDRILVMYGGKIVAEFKRGEASEQTLGLYMGGAAHV